MGWAAAAGTLMFGLIVALSVENAPGFARRVVRLVASRLGPDLQAVHEPEWLEQVDRLRAEGRPLSSCLWALSLLWGVADLRAAALGLPASPRMYRAAKRAFDLGSAAAILFAAGPWLIVIASALFIEARGSVLDHVESRGLHGKPFTLSRFRVTHPNPERSAAAIGHLRRRCVEVADQLDIRVVGLPFFPAPFRTGELPPGEVLRWSQALIACLEALPVGLDPSLVSELRALREQSMTRIGRAVDRAGLRGLPTLIAVLRGRMSLIGPRPPELLLWHRPELPPPMAVKPGFGMNTRVLIAAARAHADPQVREPGPVRIDELYAMASSWRLELRLAVLAALKPFRWTTWGGELISRAGSFPPRRRS